MTRTVSLWQASVVFVVSAAVLVRAGQALAGYADQIAERTKMSRLFVGTLFLVFATSLPEFVAPVELAEQGLEVLADHAVMPLSPRANRPKALRAFIA